MAATKRKFCVPSVEDLDEEIQVSRPKPLFNTYKKSSNGIEETKDDTYSRTTNANDHKMEQEKNCLATKIHKQSQSDQRMVSENYVPNQDPLSKESSLHPSEENLAPVAASTNTGSAKPTVGKTFRETFAFLEGTSHFKETVAKIKEKESTIEVKGSSVPVSSKSKSNAIIVNPRQKGNPVLRHIRNVPWEMGEIIPDYVLGATTCAFFLSLRYHHFNPEYIHERLKQLGQSYELRILLVQVDVKDPHQTLRELAKMAMMANCTLMLAWSPEEAGRYLETYKVYETKPPDALLGQSEGDYLSKLTDCLTTVKGINKTDVVSLSSTFGSLANMATASKEDLALLPGFGPLKAQRLHNLFQQPFAVKKSKETGDDKKL